MMPEHAKQKCAEWIDARMGQWIARQRVTVAFQHNVLCDAGQREE